MGTMTLLPPPQYDVPPTVPVIQHIVSKAEVAKYCADRLACSFALKDRCIVYLPKGSAIFDILRRHELAHCNGWHHAGEHLTPTEIARFQPTLPPDVPVAAPPPPPPLAPSVTADVKVIKVVPNPIYAVGQLPW